MDYPHAKLESLTHGGSPGNGTTEIPLSRDPLATEGEATPGPDDWNPYDEREAREQLGAMESAEDPTAGDDPYAFDDVGDELGRVTEPFELPTLDLSGPQF